MREHWINVISRSSTHLSLSVRWVQRMSPPSQHLRGQKQSREHHHKASDAGTRRWENWQCSRKIPEVSQNNRKWREESTECLGWDVEALSSGRRRLRWEGEVSRWWRGWRYGGSGGMREVEVWEDVDGSVTRRNVTASMPTPLPVINSRRCSTDSIIGKFSQHFQSGEQPSAMFWYLGTSLYLGERRFIKTLSVISRLFVSSDVQGACWPYTLQVKSRYYIYICKESGSWNDSTHRSHYGHHFLHQQKVNLWPFFFLRFQWLNRICKKKIKCFSSVIVV